MRGFSLVKLQIHTYCDRIFASTNIKVYVRDITNVTTVMIITVQHIAWLTDVYYIAARVFIDIVLEGGTGCPVLSLGQSDWR